MSAGKKYERFRTRLVKMWSWREFYYVYAPQAVHSIDRSGIIMICIVCPGFCPV